MLPPAMHTLAVPWKSSCPQNAPRLAVYSVIFQRHYLLPLRHHLLHFPHSVCLGIAVLLFASLPGTSPFSLLPCVYWQTRTRSDRCGIAGAGIWTFSPVPVVLGGPCAPHLQPYYATTACAKDCSTRIRCLVHAYLSPCYLDLCYLPPNAGKSQFIGIFHRCHPLSCSLRFSAPHISECLDQVSLRRMNLPSRATNSLA